MTGAMLADLLKSMGFLGLFLIIGVFLRAKITAFQKCFIPASVIGGFLILILGPQVLNVLPVPSGWVKIFSLIPGILIIPVVACVPLGLTLNTNEANGEASIMKGIFPLIGIGIGVSMLQFAIGFITHILFNSSQDLYATFGWELGIGFVGGHGTAAVLGSMLREANLPYWEVAQGVGITTATFGIVGGILIGIVLINWAARNGQTKLLKKPADIPESLRVGFEKDTAKQPSVGRETTFSSSIDVLAFHVAIIFVACGAAYFILAQAKAFKIPVLSSLSLWAYGIIVMFAIWGIMCKLKLQYLVDGKIKSKISGCFTEFAVIGAVASLPLRAVAAYIVPILVMVVVGYIVTTGVLFYACKRFLKGYWFEQMIATLGMSTGVFITGVLLLRICDPDLQSPALANYSLAYTVTSVTYFALLALFLNLLLGAGIYTATAVALAIGIGGLIAAGIASRACFGSEFKGN